MRFFLLVSAMLPALVACKTSTGLTADAIGCGVTDVDIIDSEFKRRGVTTAWCARCGDKVYQCATTPERDRVECRESAPGGPCG